MSELETIAVRRDGGAATVVLNRPDSMNAWNGTFSRELTSTLTQLAEDDAVRAVCLTGAGRAFSSGADLSAIEELADPDGKPDLYRLLTERYDPVIRTIRAMPKPVVAAVNGPAAGIGCSLALACDLVVAKASAYFLLAFVNIGLVPDGGASLFVPARVGFTRAAELALLGERLPAERAAEWGLINRVVADDAFDDEVTALTARLAAGPTRAYAGAKRQLDAWMGDALAGRLELEARLQAEMAATADFAEGVAAFREKRAAAFAGR